MRTKRFHPETPAFLEAALTTNSQIRALFKRGFPRALYSLIFALICLNIQAQLSGSYNIPGNFPTLAAAISSLNTNGVNGPVTINLAAGYTETAPIGGYSLTATGTSVNPITFQKNGNGANPLLTAYSGGTGIPSSATQDGIWQLIGSDFISIFSIDLLDPNTTNPATMEFGYGLYKASAADGCQNNLIVNCVITLNRVNNDSGILPASHGSRGIDVVNATPSANTVNLIVTAASGANSNNGFYLNTIQNCNYGIALHGYADVYPFTFSDFYNNMSGNTLIDFGGALTAANPAAGITASEQKHLVIANNSVNNNDGSGINHPNNLYGIEVNIADSSMDGISGNVLTLHGGGTTSQLIAIKISGANLYAGNSMDISGNLINGCTYPTATSGSFYGIQNSSSFDTLSVNGNRFFNNSTAASSGAYYSIYHSGNVTSKFSIGGNRVDTLNFTASSVSSTVCGIYCSGGAGSPNADVTGNTFTNFNFMGTTGGTGVFAGIYLTGGLDTINTTGNNFTNLNLNSSGPVYLFYNNSVSKQINGFGNVAPGFTRTATSGDTYFYYGNNAGPGRTDFSYNTMMNVSQIGSSSFYGIYNVAAPLRDQQFAGNTFNTISSGSGLTSIISMTAGNSTNCFNNQINNVNAAGAIYGINCHSGISPTAIHQNSVFSFTSTGASKICPIYLSPGSQGNVFKNNIYDIFASNAGGSAFGIYVDTNTVAAPLQSDTLSNNLIGDIRTPLANASLPLSGIYIAGGTKVYVWYNSVYLSATSSGNLFGSSALFAATTPDVELKNNILVNTSSSSGAGITCAYRRSSSNVSTYLPGSNNNLFYAGPVTTGNSVFYDGTTTYPFLSSYKTLMSGMDLLSVTENPPFLSTQGSSTAFLKIDPSIPTQIESGATPIAIITDDYGFTPRNSSSPDIGAWEDNYTTSGDVSSPTLLNSGFISSNCSTIQRTYTVNLTDVSGMAGGLLSPNLYYKINAGSYTSVQGTLLSGTLLNGTWTFNLNYTTAPLDLISYYLVAQDIATLPNLLASPPAGFSGSDVNTILSPPTTPYTYSILPLPVLSISGTSVCAGSTASLTAANTGIATYTWTGPSGYVSNSQVATVPMASNASAGQYSLSVTGVNGCAATTTTSLSVQAQPTVIVTPGTITICAGESASLSASGAISYSWKPGNLTSQTVQVSPASTSVYTVSGTNALGCVNTSSVNLIVSVCTGISSISVQNVYITLFPNPSSDVVTLGIPFEGSKEILITNALGELIQHRSTTELVEYLDLTTVTKGIYFIKILSGSKQITSKLVIR